VNPITWIVYIYYSYHDEYRIYVRDSVLEYWYRSVVKNNLIPFLLPSSRMYKTKFIKSIENITNPSYKISLFIKIY